MTVREFVPVDPEVNFRQVGDELESELPDLQSLIPPSKQIPAEEI